MNSSVAYRVLGLCLTATVLYYFFEYFAERGVPQGDALCYVIPACVVSYLVGLRDGRDPKRKLRKSDREPSDRKP